MEFTASVPPASHLPRVSRDAWVEMQLLHAFMRYARPALHAALVLIVVVTGILYRHVDAWALGTWTVAVTVVTLSRYRIIGNYHRDLVGVSGAPLHAFMARYTWTWSLSAVIWGSSMFVFFLQAPIYDQFICMLVLVGMAGFAVGTFSAHLPCFRGYVNGLGCSVMAALAWHLLREKGVPVTFNTWGIVALVSIYWTVIRISGQRFHEVQRANLELQFDNADLIASLTEKSRAALEAVEVKNRFIASAAHDLRQPVHALGLYADWLTTEPEYVDQIAPKIVRSTRAINDLFDSLFNMAGLSLDAIRVNWRMVDLAALIQDLEVQYAPMAQERGLVFRTRVHSGQTRVWSDPVLLKRLVGNLISNAMRNTPTGGVLLVLRKRTDALCIEIWDSGVGIAPEHQQAIFQEFYRVPLQGTEEGFGLGLAIVSRLSAELGHAVTLASRPGRGTVFRVELRLGANDSSPAELAHR